MQQHHHQSGLYGRVPTRQQQQQPPPPAPYPQLPIIRPPYLQGGPPPIRPLPPPSAGSAARHHPTLSLPSTPLLANPTPSLPPRLGSPQLTSRRSAHEEQTRFVEPVRPPFRLKPAVNVTKNDFQNSAPKRTTTPSMVTQSQATSAASLKGSIVLTTTPTIPLRADVNKEDEAFTKGLKMHGERDEKPEFTKIQAGVCLLVDTLRNAAPSAMLTSRASAEINDDNSNIGDIRSVQEALPHDVEMAKARLLGQLETLRSREQDIALLSSEVRAFETKISELKSSTLEPAVKMLGEADRRRKYYEVFEALAAQIAAKRSLGECKREALDEQEKLEAVTKEVRAREGFFAQRKLQFELAMHQIRSMVRELQDADAHSQVTRC